MTNADKVAFAKMMAVVQDMYVPGRPISNVKTKMYFEFLSPFPIERVLWAAEQIMKKKTISTFPLPADFLNLLGEGEAEDQVEIRALSAWETACRSVIAGGPSKEDALLNEAIRLAFGGWLKFGETDPGSEAFDRRHFVETYKAIVASGFLRNEQLETSILKELAETSARIKELKPGAVDKPAPRT